MKKHIWLLSITASAFAFSLSAQVVNLGFKVEFHSGPLQDQTRQGTFTIDTSIENWLSPADGFHTFTIAFGDHIFTMQDDEDFPDFPKAGYNSTFASPLHKIDYAAPSNSYNSAGFALFWDYVAANYVRYTNTKGQESFGSLTGVWTNDNLQDPISKFGIVDESRYNVIDLKLLAKAMAADKSVQALSRQRYFREKARK